MFRLINKLSPNPRLQRTRSAPLRSPLSRQPLGGGSPMTRWVALHLLILAFLGACACSTGANPQVSSTRAGSHSQSESAPVVSFREYCGRMSSAMVGGEIVAPRLVNRVEPEYPADLRRERVAGRVIMQGVVTTDGRLEALEITSSPDSRLSVLALAAARQWRYQPATLRGEPVKVCLAMYADFSLHAR